MFGNPETTAGGGALKFYASVRLDIRKIDTIKNGDTFLGNRARVKVIKNFENIINEVLECNPKLILMDINLPCYDGFYWCSQIRNFLKVPIIFISSRDNDMDIIMSINMGGDDYITKPFSPQVLVAKIQAILRRTYSYNNDLKSDIIKFKDITLNIVEGKVYFKDENVDLTKNELKIMNILMNNQEKIVSREEIIEELWDTDEFISENTLTVNVNRIITK